MAKSYIMAEGQIEGTVEGTIEGEGEVRPPCICEFEDNEIIPYVGTVAFPKKDGLLSLYRLNTAD